ncbi:MAG TPA: DUF4340 domain-containing protein [Steroidobacteraceae bacterium]|nr:DUF4340 domain-containing protein [Steroidobacteraceae bacterium]
MNSRSLATLAALVIMVLAAAVWVSMARHPQAEHSSTLYPALKGKLDSIQAVRIYGAGNQRKVELVRAQDGWHVSERSKYPAAPDKVRALLLGMSAAKSIEEKTSNPENYAALGVEDVAATGATGVRVELVGANGFDLIVGKTGQGANSYVRKAGDKTSWLIDRMLEAPTEPKEWLDPKLIDIAANRIQSAHIELEGQQPYTAAKATEKDANFAVSGFKKGQTLNSESAANGVSTALANLNLEDVAPYSEWQTKPTQAKATYTTFDGTILELSGWTAGDAHYIHARVRYEGQPAAQPDEKDKKAGAVAPDRKAEAAALDARLQSWVFRLPDYKYGAIFPPLENLLKK